jgi:hypothetical protein
MATGYFAKIEPADYQSFVQSPNSDFPEQFEAWSRYQFDKKTKYELEWHPNATCIDVEVKADEFRKYCSETRSHCTLEALSQFAVEKGLRKGR